MHLAPSACAFGLTLALMTPATLVAKGRELPAPAVRGLQPETAALVQQARARSATIKALVDVLDRSDLVVYVEFQPYLDSATAHTSFLAAFGGHRYLIVSINPRHVAEERIALLGHELQHAVEIAGAPEVRSEETLHRFYRREAWSTGDPRHYETAAAQQAEKMVRRELQVRAAG
jgi:hypothetical protein